jgi:hypothetical protein
MPDAELIASIKAAPPEVLAFLQGAGQKFIATMDAMFLAGESEDAMDQAMHRMIDQ